MALGLGLSSGRRGVGFDPTPYTWVGTDGNDTTGDGTFANPYKTLMQAEGAEGLTGTKATIYVKEGIYTETFDFVKAYTWRNYGAVTLRPAGTNYTIRMQGTGATVIDGFILDGLSTDGLTAATSVIETASSGVANKTFNNCSIINPKATSALINMRANTAFTFNSCSIPGSTGSYVVTMGNANTAVTFDGCTISGNHARIINGAGSGNKTFIVRNCNISLQGYLYISGGNTAQEHTVTISDNTITLASNIVSMIAQSSGSTQTGTITLSGNTIEMGSYKSSASFVNIIQTSSSVNFVTSNNNIHSSAVQAQVIYSIIDQLSADINGDVMDVQNITVSPIRVYQSTKDTTKTYVKNCEIRAANLTGYTIGIGEEATGTGDDRCKDVQIIGNLIYGLRYYLPDNTDAITHSIFVGFSEGSLVQNNKLIGCGYAVVIKHEKADAAQATVSYNVLLNSGMALMTKGHANTKFYGNTILNTTRQDFDLVILQKNVAVDIAGVEFKNNIVASAVHNNKRLIARSAGVTAAIDYNCLDSELATPFVIGATAVNLATWQATGYDVNSLIETPEVDADGVPLANSNVVGAGDDLGEDYDDGLDYNAVIPTNITTKEQATDWDIGAFVIGE